MNEKNRVLAFNKGTKISDKELTAVSGGAASLTCKNDVKATGNPPNDIEVIQVWD